MLELSTTAGYALLALGYLERSRDRWVLAKEIAQQTGVAGPYLSRILYNLVKSGLVIAKRGYRGGFCLSRPGAQIAVLEIVDAVEHQPRARRCLLGLAECSDQTACPVHLLWKSSRAQVEGSLARLTLDQFAEAVSQRNSQRVLPVNQHRDIDRESPARGRAAPVRRTRSKRKRATRSS